MQEAHADRVLASVTSARAAARSKIAASWARCFAKHRLDPAAPDRAFSPDSSRLRQSQEALGQLLALANPHLDNFHAMAGHCGRGVFLTDADGLILAGRVGASDKDIFAAWGLQDGCDWSEAAQGTNGIGTCLAEARALTIHRDQHYLPRNIGMSCIDAPVFGPDGVVVAALDVSSARLDDTEDFNRLVGAMVWRLAQQIETDLFRAHHADSRIMMVGESSEAASLFAVDRDDIVVGATRAARQQFALEKTGALSPRPLRDLTGEDAKGLEGAERAAVVRALTRAGGNVSAAARDLGVGRATLYRRMKRLGLAETGRPEAANP